MSLESMVKLLVTMKLAAIFIPLAILAAGILVCMAVWFISKYEDWTLKRLGERIEDEEQESEE